MKDSRVIIAPSILSADFSRLGEEVRKIERCGGDRVHIDVMDGHFVPNISFGHKLVEDLRRLTNLPFDVHLMTERPENFIESFALAGSDIITFHPEAAVHSHRIVDKIKKFGKKAGVSLVPSSPAFILHELLPFVDLILVMTVNPGYGGQTLIPECLEKVRQLRSLGKEQGFSYDIAVDGGINQATVKGVIDSGADVLVVGTAFFESDDPVRDVMALRGAKIV